MTTGRINQVAFHLDVGTAWASTHREGSGESKTGHERRTCPGTKPNRNNRTGTWPRAHKAFRIRKRRSSTRAPRWPHRIRGHAWNAGHESSPSAQPLRARDRRRTARQPNSVGTGKQHGIPISPPVTQSVGERLKRNEGRQFDA